ncbi:MAG: hypothetical protein JSV68_17320 [Anaerolineaceae bacterium]|nr:MAG: hypothetical protein JSV68_17320 [Anaerolineaceae bacterium]
MATYLEVAQALVDAGYVSDADIQAAADILADALVVEAAEEVEAEAMDDYSDQEDLIAEAEVWAAEDAAEGDFESLAIDKDIVDDAAEQALDDRDTVIAAEIVIDAAYTDAAAALLAAALIDEADAEAVAALLADL